LTTLAADSADLDSSDVGRLPVDRVFTIRGAGTVVTGTLWSGTLEKGDRVILLPGDVEARVRSLQVHGEEVEVAEAGKRVAVGLSGSRVSHHSLTRGQTVVTDGSWTSSWMLTCRISVLPDTGWGIQQGQRVRVHLGTAEVLARAALLQTEHLSGGDGGWAQLRLEAPLLARAGDHMVLRSYSPVTTIGGGLVAEVAHGKRKKLGSSEAEQLATVLDGGTQEALAAHLELSGWGGAWLPRLSQDLGVSPPRAEKAVSGLMAQDQGIRVGDHLISARVFEKGRQKVLTNLKAFHEEDPLRPGMPLEELRQVIPDALGPKIAEQIIQGLVGEGRLDVAGGHASLKGHEPRLTQRQKDLRDKVRSVLEEAGMAPPTLKDLGARLGETDEVARVLKMLEHQGEVMALDPGLYFSVEAVREAAKRVVDGLGGQTGLGPADFKEVLPLTRRHLLPLLRYFDTAGVTVRLQETRQVSVRLPVGLP
jgi:selenocysteine-specific elongation factor